MIRDSLLRPVRQTVVNLLHDPVRPLNRRRYQVLCARSRASLGKVFGRLEMPRHQNRSDPQHALAPGANGQFGVLYALPAARGLRIGEALALEVGHFQNGALSVRQRLWNGSLQSPKTKAGIREVDLSPDIVQILDTFIGGRRTGYIFHARNGQPLAQSNVLRRSLHPILEAMKREKAGFHSFRRCVSRELRRISCASGLVTVTGR
jgi:integrase